MNPPVVLIDYGAGNLRSVQKALEAAGAAVQVTAEPQCVRRAQKLVLPGVGAFGDGMAALQRLGLDEALREAITGGAALLGICLGMQLLFEWSEELGRHAGLGLLPGCVRRFEFSSPALKVPQTGWNQVLFNREDALLSGLRSGAYAYFNHAYYCVPQRAEDVLAETEYGLRFASMLACGRLWGAQFHPEKSQRVGLTLLKNFVEAC